MNFDINKIQKYFLERSKAELAKQPDSGQTAEQRANEDFTQMPDENFNIRAIFSIFDKNCDGKISKEEFEKISKNEYNQFISELKNYSQTRNTLHNNDSIWTYGQLQGYLNHVLADEGAYAISEDEAFFDNIGTSLIKTLDIIPDDQQKFYREKYNNDQTLALKDISQMSQDEIIAELKEYGIDTENNNIKELKRRLTEQRNNRAIYDSKSDEVDGKIGTFIQTGNNKLCSVLAELMNMNESQIQELYGETGNIPLAKTDENGEKYWEIQFPIDKGTDTKIKITEAELKSGQITFTENDEERTLGGIFPRGDADVTLLSMAFVKRFGTSILRGGAWAMQTKTKFSQEKYYDNQHLELIKNHADLEHSQINMLQIDEIKRKGIECKSLSKEDLSFIAKEAKLAVSMSDGLVTTLTDGRKACISKYGIYLSDGTNIEPGHAMSVSKYDSESKELIIISNEFGNLSQLRIPEELLVYFETASLPDTAGVKETPQPELTD